MSRSFQLPRRFPVGTKYVLESRGTFVRRYIEFKDGRRIELEPRKPQTCGCVQAASLVPDAGIELVEAQTA